MPRQIKIYEYTIKKINFSSYLERIYNLFDSSSIAYIGEVGDTAKMLLLISFWEKLKIPKGSSWDKNIIFITSDSKKTKEYIDNLKNLCFDKCFQLTSDNKTDFLKVKGKKQLFLISDIETLLEETVSPYEYRKNIISLKVGEEISEYLADYLIESGYERTKKVTKRGEFCIKGDVLDIFDNDKPVRIELLGKKVEKIYYFDPFTYEKITVGANGRSPLQIDIYPKRISDSISNIQNKKENFLLEFFDDYLFVFDGEDKINSTIYSYFESRSILQSAPKIENFINRQKRIYFEDFFVNQDKGVNLSWFAPKKYGKLFLEFISDLKKYQKEGKKIFIVTKHKDELKKIFSENMIDWGSKKEIGEWNTILLSGKNAGARHGAPKTEDMELTEGVNLSNLNIIIFSDNEIFGPEKIKKKKKIDFSAITNLKKGEYVVHIDHGIGKFIGFGDIVIDNIKREYVFIEYAKGDKVFVPLDQADKVTKYINIGNDPPILSNLASGNWLKVREKVKKNVENIAKELIETQAERETEKPFHYIDDHDIQKRLADSFFYQETADQKKTISEVLEDMKEKKPMDRLVCGDVGYGKTEVAVRASARAVASGGQVAFLVPTTILAEQHLQTFRERLDDLGINIKSLSRFRTSLEQKKIIDLIKKGGIDIVIGTHRLLSKDIKFKNLMLVIIDEEQKFGVVHKEKLKKLRSGTDILTLTATPIPRTLYLGLGGLKDISLINTPPEGRLSIETIVAKKDDDLIKRAIEEEIKRGGQVYFVHNRVETIDAALGKLRKMLPEIRFEAAHGKMQEEKLARIMNDFNNGKFNVLVTSAIIESGLDNSQVNTLIVDRSTHFGLSSLHQLRGRIGRGDRQAYAYFLYSENDLKGNARRRLKSIAEKGELGAGYELSLEDLDIRGSGNILGQQQHGSMQMVGVGYYLRLLEEEVERIMNYEPARPAGGLRTLPTGRQVMNNELKITNIKIDLPISAYIPDGFYEKEEEKIRAYQTLSGFEEEEELNDFIVDLKSRGTACCAPTEEIPKEMQNLFDIIRLKIKAKKAGIKSIVTKDFLDIKGEKKKKLHVDFDHVISKNEVEKMFKINSNFYFGNTQVKINLDKLGDEWFRKLIFIAEELEK